MSENALLIPHIRIHNANALSSPFTIGFPAMTSWLGGVHALQRKLNEQGFSTRFDGVGIISHQFDLQTYKGPGDYEYSIIGTANPVDKDGARPAFIEEARCHLEISLVIQYSGIEKLAESDVIETISKCLGGNMKLAGGDILDFEPPQFFKSFDRLRTHLMPGYALIERRELMIDAMQNGQDALDALLEYLAIHHHCEQQEQNGDSHINWSSQRRATAEDGRRGWIVPIATGFHAISELGLAKNQRDSETSHRFAEVVVTLGEFKMAYKFQQLDELLWHYRYDADNNLYLCQQISQEGF